MPSSISSSEPRVEPDVIERRVPALAWSRASLIAFAVFAVLLAGLERHARTNGMTTEDVGDGLSRWAAERRKLDRAGPDAVVILGDSRILFDTDLDLFERMTGTRPVQLAMPGTNVRPFLEEIAGDENFSGLLLVGVAEFVYFRDEIGRMAGALDRYRFESPADWSGDRLHLALSRHLAFLDPNYGLVRNLRRLDLPNRARIDGPYLEVWKVSVTGDDRHTWLWPMLEIDPYRREHARRVWLRRQDAPPLPDELVAKTAAATRDAVARIRARGGEVVFLRPPSSGPVRQEEMRRAPRERVWDALIREAGVAGIHFEDHAGMRDLDLPEYSHLSRACAQRYTRAYVEALAALTDRIRIVGSPAGADAAIDCKQVPRAEQDRS